VPIVLKSGSLNLLEPSGPVKACNGIALPFTLILLQIAEEDVKNKGYYIFDYIGVKLEFSAETVFRIKICDAEPRNVYVVPHVTMIK
jgi:hypothetical protein